MESLGFMANKNSKNNLSRPIFPEESGLIVEKILEKYGLEKKQEEGSKNFFDSQIPTERKEIFENLPGFKISKLIKECAEGKVSLANLPQELEQNLNISSKEAKQMADDLQKTILNFIKWEAASEEAAAPTGVVELTEEEISPKETKKLSQKDVYREIIE